MNKIVKAVVLLIAGAILTAGTAEAAPHHGWGRRPHCPAPRHQVVRHVHHHGGNAGLVTLGAVAVGAVIGGLISAVAN